MSRFVLAFIAAVCASTAGNAVPAHASERAPLFVGTWGGAYEDAQRKALFDPFTSRTGVEIKTVALDDALATLRGAAAGDGHVTVLDLPDTEADAACAARLLEPLDVAFFDRGDPISDAKSSDFLAQPTPCGIPSTITSEVMVYSRDAFGATTPSRVTDLFDTTKFPGMRALKRDAMGTFEWALLADGVTPGEVYNVLATPKGVRRVFAKLDSIRSVTRWWDRGDVPLTWLARGEIVMSAAYAPWAYQAIVGEHLPLVIVWSGALRSANRWVMVKGAGDDPAAREFIKFATDTQRLAEMAKLTPYGAARGSAGAVAMPEMSDYSPTTTEHLAVSMPIDIKFWREQGPALRQQFETWLQAATSQARAEDPAEKK